MVRSKMMAISVLLTLTTGPAAYASSPVLPETTTAVELSSSDINRITCPGTINDLIFSKEKGLEGHFAGNNAFVKFTVAAQGDERKYATTPTELFISCNDTIYSLIVTPKRIPSVTLRLSPPTSGDIKRNVSRYQALPLEKKILQLIREAWLAEYPDSYRITRADTLVNLSADLSVRLIGIVDVEGAGLRLKEYRVKATADEAVRVSEKDFLRAEMGERIVAVVVENQDLAKGGSSRVFIVEQRGEDS